MRTSKRINEVLKSYECYEEGKQNLRGMWEGRGRGKGRREGGFLGPPQGVLCMALEAAFWLERMVSSLYTITILNRPPVGSRIQE